MRHLFLIAFLSLVHPVLADTSFNVAVEQRAILKSGGWTPTGAHVERALVRIETFLRKHKSSTERDKSAIASILANKAGYRVQFLGLRKAGKNIIVCNFFPAQDPSKRDPFAYWKERQVGVDDGGFYFWQIEYDPAADTCRHFQSNGDA